jgi:hypothetical protein
MSYNINEAQKESPFTVSSIFAQQNSGKSRLAENSSFTIPASSWRRTPNRRMCSGTGSYLFDLRYAIATSENPSPITVWIEYDVTFHTPQIESTSPTPSSVEQYLYASDSKGILAQPNPSVDSSNETTWSVEGSFSGFITYVAYVSTSSSDRPIYTATVTFEDNSTGTIEVKIYSQQNWPRLTYTGLTIATFDDEVQQNPTTSAYPVKCFDSTKKIAKIEATLSPGSISYFIIPY